jgi:hypothetical protein
VNILILIDGEAREISAGNFEISYKKYEDYDVVIMINTESDVKTPVYEEFPPVTTPSSKGIIEQDLGIMPLVQVAGSDLMIPLRKEAGVVVINHANPPRNPTHPETFLEFKDSIKSVGLESEEFLYNEEGAFQKAAVSLFEREKKLVLTKYLVVNKEPYFEFKDKEKITLKEVITVVSLVLESEEAKVVKSI